MNPHHNIKAIQMRYKNNKEASEAIQAISEIYSETLQGFIKMISKPKQTLYEQLTTYSELLLATFKKIISNPSVTKEELVQAKLIFSKKLDDLESLLVKL